MFWTITALAGGLVLLAAVALAVAGKRIRHRRQASGFAAGAMAAADPYGGVYGLTPEEAARFHQSAREHARTHHARWNRDYIPGFAEGVLPGRIAGIPRVLRVRR